MALLDDLRAAAATVDHQFQPTANELVGVVSGLALYLEHGEKFLDAAQAGGTSAVTDLISGQGEPPSQTPEESDQAAADASRRATAQQTQLAEHEPAADKSSTSTSGKKGKS